ncbi:MAG: hypothetical protein HYR67_10635 [Bacteroidetes bacterium]|nr:hypothetical protein [Bacteroidota bacterium]
MRLFTFVILLVLVSCQNRDQKKEEGAAALVDENLQFQEKTLRGKKINVASVVGDSIDLSKRLLLVYSGYDCGSCVNAAFYLVKKVDSLAKSNHSVIVEIQSDKGRDQLRYKYQQYIYSDNDDLIRKQLKFIKTPAILSFDESGKIDEVYFPQDVQSINESLIQKFAPPN